VLPGVMVRVQPPEAQSFRVGWVGHTSVVADTTMPLMVAAPLGCSDRSAVVSSLAVQLMRTIVVEPGGSVSRVAMRPSIHLTASGQDWPVLSTIRTSGEVVVVVVGALWGVEEHAASATKIGARATSHHRLGMARW